MVKVVNHLPMHAKYRFEVAVEKVADCDELRGLIYSDETCR